MSAVPRGLTMKKTIIIYSLAMASAAFVLQWLDFRYSVRMLSTEIYIVAIAVGFTAMGIWVGHRLTERPVSVPAFEKNCQAIEYLGISEREYEVLEQLAAGHSNKEIAEKLFVSPNTVKTHLANIYGKLDVSRRTQAIHKARALGMIP